MVAVCDVDRRRAEAGKAKVDKHYGDSACKLFTDWRECLEMEGVDVDMAREAMRLAAHKLPIKTKFVQRLP